MRICALFWFYKDFDTCRDRVVSARKADPNLVIFGLYGGPLSSAATAQEELGPLLDDFWTFPDPEDAKWKWRNGDMMITRWFTDRGQLLSWDSIFVMQWDMLVSAPLHSIFHMLGPGEILISGFRPIDEVASVWWWAKKTNHDVAKELADFKAHLAKEFNYEKSIYACLFVVACLPRSFLERYAASGPPSIGFMEYKLPTMAMVFNTPVCTSHPFEPGGWNAPLGCHALSPPGIFLNAIGCEPPTSKILRELNRRDGLRVFHPVRTKIRPWMLERQNLSWLSFVFFALECYRYVRSRLGTLFRVCLASNAKVG